jgi:hypothetical protein
MLLLALVASVMRMDSAPSMAALSAAHVVLPFLSISSTPFTSTTDCVLLLAAEWSREKIEIGRGMVSQ